VATKKKRLARSTIKKRAGENRFTAKKRTGRKRVAAKRAAPKRHSSTGRRRASGRPSTRKKRVSKSTTVRRKERKVADAQHRLNDAEKELAVEQRPKQIHPATKRRGADPDVPSRSKRKHSTNPKEQKLEQGLEESMAGSDPISVTQPTTPIAERPDDHAEASDDDS
jgi:hypothetical protein